jgi:hypothetical protein
VFECVGIGANDILLRNGRCWQVSRALTPAGQTLLRKQVGNTDVNGWLSCNKYRRRRKLKGCDAPATTARLPFGGERQPSHGLSRSCSGNNSLETKTYTNPHQLRLVSVLAAPLRVDKHRTTRLHVIPRSVVLLQASLSTLLPQCSV